MNKILQLMDKVANDQNWAADYLAGPDTKRPGWLARRLFVWFMLSDFIALALMSGIGLISTLALACIDPDLIKHPPGTAVAIFWIIVLLPAVMMAVATTIASVYRYRELPRHQVGEQLPLW